MDFSLRELDLIAAATSSYIDKLEGVADDAVIEEMAHLNGKVVEEAGARRAAGER